MFLKTKLKLLWQCWSVYSWHDGNKNNLRTIEAQIVQKLKNEARPKFTGSYKKMRVLEKESNKCAEKLMTTKPIIWAAK